MGSPEEAVEELFFKLIDYPIHVITTPSSPSYDHFFQLYLRQTKHLAATLTFRNDGRYFLSQPSPGRGSQEMTRYEIDEKNWIPHKDADRSLYQLKIKEKQGAVILISQRLMEVFQTRAVEEEARVLSEVSRFVREAKETNAKFKLMVVSGEYLEIDDSQRLPLPEHIRQFLPYEDDEKNDYFSAVVVPEKVQKVNDNKNSSLFSIELSVLSIQNRSFEPDEEAEGAAISLEKDWFDLADCADIRFPEVRLNDGGCVNCYGASSTLFAPLEAFLTAKREFLQDKRRNSSHLPYLMQEKLLQTLPDHHEEEAEAEVEGE